VHKPDRQVENPAARRSVSALELNFGDCFALRAGEGDRGAAAVQGVHFGQTDIQATVGARAPRIAARVSRAHSSLDVALVVKGEFADLQFSNSAKHTHCDSVRAQLGVPARYVQNCTLSGSVHCCVGPTFRRQGGGELCQPRDRAGCTMPCCAAFRDVVARFVRTTHSDVAIPRRGNGDCVVWRLAGRKVRIKKRGGSALVMTNSFCALLARARAYVYGPAVRCWGCFPSAISSWLNSCLFPHCSRSSPKAFWVASDSTQPSGGWTGAGCPSLHIAR
jgi:hypothetical protein